MQYLMFQLFTAGAGFNTDQPIAADFPDKQAREILAAIGTIGDRFTRLERRLGIMVGPLCLDYTDDQLCEIIDRTYALVVDHHLAIGFHIDDSKFWKRCDDLWVNPDNVEALNWEGEQNTGQYLNWGEEWKLAPQACFNAPQVVEEARHVAKVIGDRIAYNRRRHKNKDTLAGVIVGWETAIGPDYDTRKALGFRALLNKGFSEANPPASFEAETEIVIREWIDVWAQGLIDGGVEAGKLYSHITSANAPIGAAFGGLCQPGFSAYPGTGVMEQADDLLSSANPRPAWCLAEGANVNIDAVPAIPGPTDMLTYIDGLFANGATIVNLFGWGIGEPDNVFRKAIESGEALAAFRTWITRVNPV